MNNVQTARCRKAQGRLLALLSVWPTSTCTRSSEALSRAHPEDTTLSRQQADRTFRTTLYCRVGWLSSYLPPKLLRKPRYGALNIVTKTPQGNTVDCLHPWQHCLGMESAITRTSPTPDNLPAAEICATSNRRTLWRSDPPSPSHSHKRKP